MLLLLPVSAAVRVSCCWLMGALGVGRGVKGRERYNFLIFCRVSNAQKKPKNKPPAAANRSQLHNHLLASFSLSLFLLYLPFFFYYTYVGSEHSNRHAASAPTHRVRASSTYSVFESANGGGSFQNLIIRTARVK